MAVSRVKTSSILQGFPKSRSLLAGNTAFSPSSYESIATVTATGGETSFSFTSIAGTYSSLQIRALYRDTTAASTLLQVQFNADTTGANYPSHNLTGSGTTVTAAANVPGGIYVQGFLGGSTAANIYGVGIIDILDYASTTKNKTLRAFAGGDTNGVTACKVGFSSGVWLSTAAVTTVVLKPGSTAFAAGSTFALYGIK